MAFADTLPTSSGADRRDPAAALVRYRLANGLDVILVPDHRVPKVAVDLSYRVGAMNEPPGRSGFAHLFEHLMFSGTPAHPSIDAVYGAAGVNSNAYTWDDRTTYCAEGLASCLPLILSVEADRMANQGAAITREHLDLQREVVLNEMRQNVLDTVGEAGMEAIRTAVFPTSHPYSRAVIGSIPDLAAATIEDVRAFFDIYYAPTNATLVVVGDLDVGRVPALIEQTFGLVTPGAPVARPVPPGFAPTRARLELEDRVPTPNLLLGWTIPAVHTAEMGYLRVLVELWNNPDYGLFRTTLIDGGTASSVEVQLETGVLGSRLIARLNAAEGHDAASLEAAAKAAIAGFLAGEIGEEEIARERRRLILGDRANNEHLLGLADDIVIFAEAADDPARALRDDANVAAATPRLVMDTARAFLQPADASMVIVRPGERGVYPAVLTTSSGISSPLPTLARAPVQVPGLEAGPLPLSAPPAALTATLGNGIELRHYRLPGAALNTIVVSSSAGIRAAPSGKEGIIEFATGMAASGPAGMHSADFGRAIKDLGAEIDTRTGWLATGVTLSAPTETLAESARLFAQAIRSPAFDRHEWDVMKAEALDDLGLREGDLDHVAVRYAEAALLSEPGAPRLDRSLKSVRALKRADVRKIYPRVFCPGAVTLHSVGPASLEAIRAALEPAFGDWSSAEAPLPARPLPAPDFSPGPRVLIVPEPGATQAALLFAVPAATFGSPRYPAASVVGNLLAFEFVSRINAVIREEKAFTYGTGGALYGATLRQGSILTVEVPVERDVVGATLAEIMKGFASLKTAPPTAEELRRSILSAHLGIASFAETGADLVDMLWGQLAGGSTLERLYAHRVAVTRLDLSVVREEAASMAGLDEMLVVVVGEPEIVAPQLAAVGLPIEVVARDL